MRTASTLTSTCSRCGAALETETGEVKCRCGITVVLKWPARDCDVIVESQK